MTPPTPAPSTPPPPPPVATAGRPAAPGWFSLAALWSVGQFVVALGATIGALVYLIVHPGSQPEPAEERPAPAEEPVRVVGPGLIGVNPASPLVGKLTVAEVRLTKVTAPVLTVTGTVVASLRPGNGKAGGAALAAVAGMAAAARRSSDFWQFNSPEVLTTFTDWQKAKADIVFARMQLVRIREAATARTAAQRELVATMAKLEAAGTETKKQLAVEQATLRQYEIQQEKEVYEAETAIRVAERNEAAGARLLQQAGLDPALLGSVNSDVDLVMADVPEGFLGRVKVGDGCEARFFGIPDEVFAGRVKSIAPVLAKDRRSLRVLFTVDDFNDQLRPGMFAEIGLGTDPREAVLTPAEGVLHLGRSDYLLVAAGEAGAWRVAKVEVGELRDGKVEILNHPKPGITLLKPGDRVMGQGAILFKPVVAQALRENGGGS